jgi:hypothetical protein
MAIELTSKTNTEAASAEYPYGQFKDNTGSNNGTPLNKAVLEDYLQFFHKMMGETGVVYNGVPDNEYDGWQFWEAFEKATGRGAWESLTYSALNLDASSGTWTVPSASNCVVDYVQRGKTVTLNFRVTNSTISLTPQSLRLKLPAGMTISATQFNAVGQYTNGNDTPTFGPLRIEASPGLQELFISKFSGNHATISGGLDVLGQITFEIL